MECEAFAWGCVPAIEEDELTREPVSFIESSSWGQTIVAAGAGAQLRASAVETDSSAEATRPSPPIDLSCPAASEESHRACVERVTALAEFKRAATRRFSRSPSCPVATSTACVASAASSGPEPIPFTRVDTSNTQHSAATNYYNEAVTNTTQTMCGCMCSMTCDCPTVHRTVSASNSAGSNDARGLSTVGGWARTVDNVDSASDSLTANDLRTHDNGVYADNADTDEFPRDCSAWQPSPPATPTPLTPARWGSAALTATGVSSPAGGAASRSNAPSSPNDSLAHAGTSSWGVSSVSGAFTPLQSLLLSTPTQERVAISPVRRLPLASADIAPCPRWGDTVFLPANCLDSSQPVSN